MMLICLDEVHKRLKHKEGRCISHDRAPVPRLTILAHDKETENYIFDHAFNKVQTTQNNYDYMPPPQPVSGYNFVGGVRGNLSLMKFVNEYNDNHTTCQPS